MFVKVISHPTCKMNSKWYNVLLILAKRWLNSTQNLNIWKCFQRRYHVPMGFWQTACLPHPTFLAGHPTLKCASSSTPLVQFFIGIISDFYRMSPTSYSGPHHFYIFENLEMKFIVFSSSQKKVWSNISQSCRLFQFNPLLYTYILSVVLVHLWFYRIYSPLNFTVFGSNKIPEAVNCT